MKHALIWDNPWELPVPSSQTHLDIFQEGWLICLETLEGVIHFKVSILRYSTRLHFKLLHDTMVLRGDWLYKSFWQDSAIDPHSNQDWFKTDYKISALPINVSHCCGHNQYGLIRAMARKQAHLPFPLPLQILPLHFTSFMVRPSWPETSKSRPFLLTTDSSQAAINIFHLTSMQVKNPDWWDETERTEICFDRLRSL